MQTLKQKYMLQDQLTNHTKMYKMMTLEAAQIANSLITEHASRSQWVLDQRKPQEPSAEGVPVYLPKW